MIVHGIIITHEAFRTSGCSAVFIRTNQPTQPVIGFEKVVPVKYGDLLLIVALIPFKYIGYPALKATVSPGEKTGTPLPIIRL